MSEQTERSIIFSKSLENIRKILQSNNQRLNDDDDDEIVNKRAKKSSSSTGILPNQHALLDYLVKPDLKQIADRKNKESDGSKSRTVILKTEQTDRMPISSSMSNRRVFISQNEQSNLSSPVNFFSDLVFVPFSSQSSSCCDSESMTTNSDYWDNFHISTILREQMIKISKRLTNNQSIILVDTHCHFDLIFDRLYLKHNNVDKYFHDYKDLYPEIFQFEYAIQVYWRPKHMVEKNWIEQYSKYLEFERVYGSCGIHPHWSYLWTQTTANDLERCLQHPKVIAIGEMGFDFGPKNTCNLEQQTRVFEEQLKLAVKWSKPVVIHSRDAYQQTFEILKKNLQSNHKIHLHCFLGTFDDVLLFNSYFTEIKFGFTPIITRLGSSLSQVLQQIDIKQILAETDSPYFVPEELFQYSRCAHPSMVYSVIETIAYIRDLSVHEVASELRENARDIYGI